MTRFLSQVLEAPEPSFRLGLRHLEAVNGAPNADIRLSNEVSVLTARKLQELGLDPKDTTAEELYHSLQARLAIDDQRLTRTLRTLAARHVSAEADVVAGMIHALQALPESKCCYGLKQSRLKSFIREVPPKKTMKQLGYRSIDSLLKHESALAIVAAAWLVEANSWRQRYLDHYKQLKAADFENRQIAFVYPRSARWQKLAQQSVATERHNILRFVELGALVFLPMADEAPAGATTACLSLAVESMNDIRVASSFLKFCQVRSDFNNQVRLVATEEPRLSSRLLDQAMPWRMVQRYYARFSQAFREEVFEPHMQFEDIQWQSVEHALSAIEPSFTFWHETAHLGLLQQGKTVSLNLLDAALNYCNQLPFELRLTHHFKQSLWHELLLRYLRHDMVEQSVLRELQPELAEEMVTV